MKQRIFFVLILVLALSVFAHNAHAGSIYLESAANFAVLGGSTVTSTAGATILEGDLGLYPGSSFGTDENDITVDGAIASPSNLAVQLANPVAMQAQADLSTAISNLGAEGPGVVLSASSYDTSTGETLLPSVYSTGSTLEVSGTLYLDFNNEPDASFVFLVGSSLTVDGSSAVVLENVGSGDSVFWVMPTGSATIGTYAAFEGNILAGASITVDTGATISCGRALASGGAVTLDTNTISTACENAPVTNTSTRLTAAGNSFLEASDGLGGASVPEPSSFLLLGTGLLAVGLFVHRKITPQ